MISLSSSSIDANYPVPIGDISAYAMALVPRATSRIVLTAAIEFNHRRLMRSAQMKLIFLRLAKSFGFFALARYLTADCLRIICYHGFSIGDEYRFRPSLFMTADTFARRLRFLSENGYRVIDLQTAHEDLRNNDIKSSSVVITIDDGFYGVCSLALPLLKKYNYPSTLYVTSYYVKHPNPIFRLAMQYLFWKTGCEFADFSKVAPGMSANSETKGEGGDRNLWRIIDYAEQRIGEEERNALLDKFAEILMIDFRKLREERIFNLATLQELDTMQAEGVNIQLHTHRHRMPSREVELCYEIEKNREVLNLASGSKLTHFCYPSGEWSKGHWPILARLGIETATTCEPGLNDFETPRLALKRFLDRDDFTDLEFEAEITGFKEIIRRIRNRFNKIIRSSV